MNPAKSALHTAKWARTMTKWLVTYTRRKGAKWHVIDFVGDKNAESRGIVDLIAIRKNHRRDGPGLKRGDLFEIVLVQTKGGSARRPTDDDIARLQRVARHHRAGAVVLAVWQRGEHLDLFKLVGSRWHPVSPDDVFG
jgi:hypothetical protein